jgi:radical SAM protein (TIGR01212 family)
MKHINPNNISENFIQQQDCFYSFNKYLREKFGERVHRISIDGGFNCPNIDDTLSSKGCIFCNNKAFVKYDNRFESIEDQIKESMEFYNQKMGVNKFIAYFQAFSSTYADIKTLQKKYDIIRNFSNIVGLFISTRPDCIEKEKIKFISEYTHDYLVWMEYGLQTTHNNILKQINRNHTYEDFLNAYEITRKYNINVGVHIILGLPFQKSREIRIDAERLANLDIQGIKFHVLHVLKNTTLESLYIKKKIPILTEDEYICYLCDFLERIPKNFVILRLVSTASPIYLISPQWMNKKSTLKNEIIQELKKRGTIQGSYFNKT